MANAFESSISTEVPSSSNVRDIEIKPPIDLIPDEYTRKTNGNFYVEAFFSEKDRSAIELSNYLEELKFSVTRTDLDKNLFDSKWITRVQKNVNDNEYDGMLLLFAKVHLEVEAMKKIWSNFTSKHCPKLKNKPKIFIFQVKNQMETSVRSDSIAKELKWPAAYETPFEADMLIIHDKYDNDLSADLLKGLRENIVEYGAKENIITLINIKSAFSNQPLIISTMTRKFFFVDHHLYRGHSLSLLEDQNQIQQYIQELLSRLSPTPKGHKLVQHDGNFCNRNANSRRSGRKSQNTKPPWKPI